MSVRTELIKLINLALTLVLSCTLPPNAGSFCVDPHPTSRKLAICSQAWSVNTSLTSCKESILGQYCDRIYEEDRDYAVYVSGYEISCGVVEAP